MAVGGSDIKQDSKFLRTNGPARTTLCSLAFMGTGKRSVSINKQQVHRELGSCLTAYIVTQIGLLDNQSVYIMR